jgi:8-hydroxy-5-deazaflavin:NADPH oxidoreductase
VLVKVGVIGAGNIGATLARRLTALGHQVAVANSRGPETLSELADETGATAVDAGEVADGADLVIVTIPQKAIPLLREGILDGAAAGAPIVDTGNYYPARDGRIDAIESGMAESRWVSEQLGHPVVKAFNTIRAQHLLELGKPAGAPGRIALPIAGDDPNSKRIVMGLVDALGFDPVDAGTIDESWRQQPGKPVYAADLDATAVTRALAEASPERPENLRA